MMLGGSVFLAYDFITEFLRHHDENNLRPKVMDHMFAMSLIGTLGAFSIINTPMGAF